MVFLVGEFHGSDEVETIHDLNLLVFVLIVKLENFQTLIGEKEEYPL